MSLYTISRTDQLPSIRIPNGLRMEESTDITLLASIGGTTVNDMINRFANGHLAFIAYMEDKPAAFGWIASGKARIGELDHELILPANNRYLWNFRTMEPYRGLGIYPALLQYILRHEQDNASRFWIIHAPENKSSLSGIKKAGFQYVGKLYLDSNAKTTIETNSVVKNYHHLLEHMGIRVSEQLPVSCWNCTSPYVKKRKPGCCCTVKGDICISHNILSQAS